ncbi:hypothetical protein [Streptomyces sp. NPDC002746]
MPYIALTEGEDGLATPDVMVGEDRWIRYRTPQLWDHYPYFDVLLARTKGAPSGRPDGSKLSPYRQFHCMDRLLCQGCGTQPAARNPDHPGEVLWVQAERRKNGEPTSPTGRTDMPPSCARCALHRCPVLTSLGRRLVWVRQAELYGVYADLFPPPKGNVVPEQLVPFHEKRMLSCAVATRLVRDVEQARPASRDVVAELAARQAASCRPYPGAGRA